MRTTTLLTALLSLTSTSLAAPTPTQPRPHCRCVLVSSPQNALESPSAAHWSPASWTPSDPTPSASPYHQTADTCSALGPDLDAFRLAKPHLYESYVRDKLVRAPNAGRDADEGALDADSPLPTQVLMHGAAHTTARPHERIECYPEPEAFGAYSDSCLTLWALQIIVALTILACLAEGLHLGLRWVLGRESGTHTHAHTDSQKDGASAEKALRLPGAERLLLAIPSQSTCADLYSPGAEKKSRAYEGARWFVVNSKKGGREFVAYESEDDDEAGRPVM